MSPVLGSPSVVEQDLTECPDDDLDIEPQRPVLYVEVVVSGAVGDGSVPPKATNLGEARQPHLHAVTVCIPIELCRELLYEVWPFWPRTDQRHIAANDVPQLGQFVDRGAAKDPSDRTDAVVGGH